MELFGIAHDGEHQPFDLYSMRQAIEEGFIEDVLANYVTYKQYFQLEKAILDDPDYETAKARAAIARFVTLHPENLAQKAEIVVEHFREKIASHVAGKAKAMVVCSSRPHAVRMWRQLMNITDQGYDLGVLVRFDEIEDSTESKANGFSDTKRQKSSTPATTGSWSWPKSSKPVSTNPSSPPCTSTRPSPAAAVQTLSRLNRIHPDKTGTFVLDFVNDPDQIRDSFATYHNDSRSTSRRT